MIAVTESNFEDVVLKSGKPFLLDLWGPWCGPCREMLPIVEEVERELGDSIIVGTCNVDENPNVPANLNAMTVPSFFLFIHGFPVRTFTGKRTKQQIRQVVSEAVSGA